MSTKLLSVLLSTLPVAALAATDAAVPAGHSAMQHAQMNAETMDSFAYAKDPEHPDGHGGTIYHSVSVELDSGITSGGSETVSSWDLSGWVGGDANKLWLKSEGELEGSDTKTAEFWALYSRKISDYWDAQIGARMDVEPESTGYAVVGFEGLAPYFFETGAHLLVSEDGDLSARLRQQNELLWTQRLISEPFFEINLAAGDNKDLGVGSGLSDIEVGLQTRYEIDRAFAPYAEVRYERAFGQTADYARDEGESTSEWIGALGVKLLF